MRLTRLKSLARCRDLWYNYNNYKYMYEEPGHTMSPRTTATSKKEGRMVDSYLTRKKKRKAIYDGVGGCGKKKY